MYTDNPTTPIPVDYMLGWYAGPEGENIAQASNDWSGQNYSRYQNAEYDELFEQVRLETDLEKAAELFIQMNDILINDVAVVPIVNRAAAKYGISTTLQEANVAHEPLRIQLLEYRQLEPEGVATALTPTPLPARWERGFHLPRVLTPFSALRAGEGALGRYHPETRSPHHPSP